METDSMLSTYLRRLSESLPKPIVLFIDEIDALVGDSLVAMLRQIRAGYANRPDAFPNSIVLCGVRDVRDYRIVLSNQDIITGGSAFNIKAESLRLGNFTPEGGTPALPAAHRRDGPGVRRGLLPHDMGGH